MQDHLRLPSSPSSADIHLQARNPVWWIPDSRRAQHHPEVQQTALAITGPALAITTGPILPRSGDHGAHHTLPWTGVTEKQPSEQQPLHLQPPTSYKSHMLPRLDASQLGRKQSLPQDVGLCRTTPQSEERRARARLAWPTPLALASHHRQRAGGAEARRRRAAAQVRHMTEPASIKVRSFPTAQRKLSAIGSLERGRRFRRGGDGGERRKRGRGQRGERTDEMSARGHVWKREKDIIYAGAQTDSSEVQGCDFVERRFREGGRG